MSKARKLTQEQHEEVWIPVGRLSVVWATATRGLNDAHVARIMEAFDPDAFGVIIVTLPDGDGLYHIIDGQHRVETVRRMWGDEEKVPCRVVNAKTPKRAAQIWIEQNKGRKGATQIDDFRIHVVAGFQPWVEVDALIRGHGYTIGNALTDGTMRAVGACLKVRRKWGLVVFKDTLEAIQAAWEFDRHSTHQGIVTGFGETLGKYGDEIDRKRLADKVKKKYTPVALVAKARSIQEFTRVTLGERVSLFMLSAYNSGLKKANRVGD